MTGREVPPRPTPEEAAAIPADPPRLPPHLELKGIEPAADEARRMLRFAGAEIPGMGDTELLVNAVECERSAREWPPDITAALLAFVYRAEVWKRADESRECDKKQRFLRMARKAGFVLRNT